MVFDNNFDHAEGERLLGFASQTGTRWQGMFGADQVFDGAIPVDKVRDLMSYPLVEGRLTATYEDGRREAAPLPDHKAIIRADTGETLGIFKKGYQIHQPEEWLVNQLSLLTDSDLQIGAASVLKRGRVALVQLEHPEVRESAEGVRFRPYLSAATSHDGSIATTYFTGSIVVSCFNQMSFAMKDADASMKVRHTRYSQLKLGDARDRLGLVVAQSGDEIDQEIRRLTSQYVTDEKFEEIVQAFTGEQKLADKGGRAATMAANKADKLRGLWNVDDRVAPWANSAYGVLSAFNTASNHEFSVKGDRYERNQLRAVDGTWAKFDSKVLRLLETV